MIWTKLPGVGQVPMLYQLLSSGSPRCHAERRTIIRVLLNCSRSDDDLDLAPLRKRHLPSPTFEHITIPFRLKWLSVRGFIGTDRL